MTLLTKRERQLLSPILEKIKHCPYIKTSSLGFVHNQIVYVPSVHTIAQMEITLEDMDYEANLDEECHRALVMFQRTRKVTIYPVTKNIQHDCIKIKFLGDKYNIVVDLTK